MNLIERLRKGIVTSAPYEPQYTVPPVKICLEAADEIERLTAEEKMQLEQIVNQGLEIARLTSHDQFLADANKQWMADCERLTAELTTSRYWREQEVKDLTAERDALVAAKDGAYLERNQLVALLSKVFPAGKKQTAIEGWSEDWHGCVYIDLPTGQASWHYHDSQAYLFDHLPEYQGVWDGHTTDEKYERIAAIQGAGK